MTTLSHSNRIAQHSGVARFERVAIAARELASDIGGIFTNWTAARRELAQVSRKAKLAKRSQRMIRTAI
ncbi:MAG: hypothetical protein Q8R63_04985 [Ramlibacter sp.]|nr:hypothetical protein [Ramlibacter sp.]